MLSPPATPVDAGVQAVRPLEPLKQPLHHIFEQPLHQGYDRLHQRYDPLHQGYDPLHHSYHPLYYDDPLHHSYDDPLQHSYQNPLQLPAVQPAPVLPAHRLGQLLAGRLLLTAVLGVGAYGVVYSARDIVDGARYAVKALPRAGLDARQQRFQQREIALHQRAGQHPNVLALHRVLDGRDCTFVVLELCPDGDLFSSITAGARFAGNDALVRRVFVQLLDAVAHCHAVGVYHRDLKPENVLLADGGASVRLADFGLATDDPLSPDFGCGSTFYMSPECVQPAAAARAFACYASAPNDVWSLGVILVNLTCARNPWKGAHADDPTFRAFLRQPAFLASILPLSPELDAILARVFDPNPATRITLPELRHRILTCPRFTTTTPTTTVGTVPAALPPQTYPSFDGTSSASSDSDTLSLVSVPSAAPSASPAASALACFAQPPPPPPSPACSWFNPFFSQLARHISMQPPPMLGQIRIF